VNILVTGGAGYVGSHTVQALEASGHQVLVVDNLVSGHRSAVRGPLVVADVSDRKTIADLIRAEGIEGVIHFAASLSVGESMANPGKYFRNNVAGTQALLDTLVETGVRYIVFSSTSAVYGQPRQLPVVEDSAMDPESPYGESKLMVERMLKWYDRCHGLRSVALRYFNAAGSALDGSIGDDVRPATRIVPVALEVALGKRPRFSLFGTDYDTPDGTCIRDYIHPSDLATAHVRALDALRGGLPSDAFNVGTGQAHSNREIIDAIKRITGVDFPIVEEPRRPGDPARSYADNTKIVTKLGWRPQWSDVETIVRTAWDWRSHHPEGYPD
jgi:UDP-glucose 4-epimerase